MTASFPYLEFLGGFAPEIPIADGSGNTGTFPMVRAAWSPAVASWRRSFLGNQPPYEDVVEEFRVNIRGTTAAEVMANVRRLNQTLDTAEQWYANELVAPSVRLLYAPQGSTISSTADPLQALVIGRAVGNETNLNLTERFNDIGLYREINDVRVRFWRRGPWIASGTQTTGGILPTVPSAQASIGLATELTRITELGFTEDPHHTWSPMSVEWMVFEQGTTGYTPPNNMGTSVLMVSDSFNIFRSSNLGGSIVADESSPDGSVDRFASGTAETSFNVTGTGLEFDYVSGTITDPRDAKWFAAIITARAFGSGTIDAVVDVGLNYQFGRSSEETAYVTLEESRFEEYTRLLIIPLVAQPDSAESLTVRLATRIREPGSTVDVDHFALLGIAGRGDNLLVFGSVPASTPGGGLGDYVHTYWIARDQTVEAITPDVGNFDYDAYSLPIGAAIRYLYVNRAQGNLSMQNKGGTIQTYVQALEVERTDMTMCDREDAFPGTGRVPMYYRARGLRRLAYLTPE